MLLPDHYSVDINNQKRSGYLLNLENPDGRTKAVFLLRHGFDNVEYPKQALLEMVSKHPVVHTNRTIYGTKYVVDGWLTSQEQQQIKLRSVWIVLPEKAICTFVTAYPI